MGQACTRPYGGESRCRFLWGGRRYRNNGDAAPGIASDEIHCADHFRRRRDLMGTTPECQLAEQDHRGNGPPAFTLLSSTALGVDVGSFGGRNDFGNDLSYAGVRKVVYHCGVRRAPHLQPSVTGSESSPSASMNMPLGTASFRQHTTRNRKRTGLPPALVKAPFSTRGLE